jgi:glyoxylase-like metal-dependent hydrolase (beta-lactamase superfamily II)
MTYRVDRIAGRAMPVNAFVVHGPDGLVVVDGMLTISDAALVRQAIAEADVPLAGVVVTHPHPDHYAGLWHVIGDAGVPIVATRAVAEVIRRDDAIKNDVVGPMMGAEWRADVGGRRARPRRVTHRQPVAPRSRHGVRR